MWMFFRISRENFKKFHFVKNAHIPVVFRNIRTYGKSSRGNLKKYEIRIEITLIQLPLRQWKVVIAPHWKRLQCGVITEDEIPVRFVLLKTSQVFARALHWNKIDKK